MFSVFLFGLAFLPWVIQGQQQKVFDDLLLFGERLAGLDLGVGMESNGCESAVGSDLFLSGKNTNIIRRFFWSCGNESDIRRWPYADHDMTVRIAISTSTRRCDCAR